MSRTYPHWIRSLGFLAFAAAACLFAGNAQAQQKTVERIPAGPHEVQVQMTHSTVVLVEGNHLVARLEDGRLEAIQVPEDFRFHMNGRTLSVHELQPGMVITETVTSISKPMIVKTVHIDQGTVWHTAGENVVIRDRNNKLNEYRIPGWAKVNINGVDRTVFDLRRGMKVTTTIITEEPLTVVEQQRKTTVRHPVEPTKPVVAEQPPVQEPTEAQPVEPEPAPAAQPPAEELPRTASPLPLIGLLGFLSLAASLGLRMLRKLV